VKLNEPLLVYVCDGGGFFVFKKGGCYEKDIIFFWLPFFFYLYLFMLVLMMHCLSIILNGNAVDERVAMFLMKQFMGLI